MAGSWVSACERASCLMGSVNTKARGEQQAGYHAHRWSPPARVEELREGRTCLQGTPAQC